MVTILNDYLKYMAIINFCPEFVIDRDSDIQYEIRFVWELLVECKKIFVQKKRVQRRLTIGLERVVKNEITFRHNGRIENE